MMLPLLIQQIVIILYPYSEIRAQTDDTVLRNFIEHAPKNVLILSQKWFRTM